jgi:fatty acid desaturase
VNLAERPALPASYYQLSALRTLLGIGYAVLLWLIPIVTLQSIWRGGGPLWMQAALSLPLVLLAAQGIVLLVFLGHDGSHLNLHRNRYLSTVLSVLLTMPAWPHCEMGFALCHWNHHRYTNTDSDPDCAGYKKHKTFLSRLLVSRLDAMWVYLETTLRMAFGLELDRRKQYRLAVTGMARRALCFFNLFTWTFMLGLLCWTALTDPLRFYILLAVLATAIMILGLNPYIEHAGTGIGHGNDTRSRLGWWWSLLYLGQNHHLAHHLYPSVPFYNLPKVHRFLRDSGYLEAQGCHLSHGLLDTYRHALASSAYPKGAEPDDIFDVVAASREEGRRAGSSRAGAAIPAPGPAQVNDRPLGEQQVQAEPELR